MSWFTKKVPLTFCDIVKAEVAAALKARIEIDIITKAWHEETKKISKPIPCENYCNLKSKKDKLWDEITRINTEYYKHINRLTDLINQGDIVRVEVNGIMYDLDLPNLYIVHQSI